MRKTTESTYKLEERLLLNTKELQNMLGCGRDSAVKFGLQAGARIAIGARVFWNLKRIRDYLS